MFAFE